MGWQPSPLSPHLALERCSGQAPAAVAVGFVGAELETTRVTGGRWGVGRFLLPLFFSTVFPAVVLRVQEAEAVTVREAILLQLGETIALVGVLTSDTYRANDRTENGLFGRDRSDFRFPLIIPFKTIAITTIITVLVATMCHLVLRRRAAERRERETTLLLRRIMQAEEKRQQAEEALRLSAKIVDTMADGDYLIRVQDGQIVHADRGLEQMFGVPDLYTRSGNAGPCRLGQVFCSNPTRLATALED